MAGVGWYWAGHHPQHALLMAHAVLLPSACSYITADVAEKEGLHVKKLSGTKFRQMLRSGERGGHGICWDLLAPQRLPCVGLLVHSDGHCLMANLPAPAPTTPPARRRAHPRLVCLCQRGGRAARAPAAQGLPVRAEGLVEQ